MGSHCTGALVSSDSDCPGMTGQGVSIIEHSDAVTQSYISIDGSNQP